MRTVMLPSGATVPALGLGTWRMGGDPGTRAEELATLRLGLDLGLSLIDTAEMYGEGLAEELVGEAIQGRRDEVFLISKVYPHNASRDGVIAACERSLRRLATGTIDLYLVHWRGRIPLSDTIVGFLALQEAGKIRHFGVSNFDTDDMEEVWSTDGGDQVSANQLLYNPLRRGIEVDLMPWLRERRVPVIAYSPFDEGRLLRNTAFTDLAQARGMTPAQLALAWLLRHPDVIAIPKTSKRDRLPEIVESLEHDLDQTDLAALDRLFPPPRGKRPLEML